MVSIKKTFEKNTKNEKGKYDKQEIAKDTQMRKRFRTHSLESVMKDHEYRIHE